MYYYCFKTIEINLFSNHLVILQGTPFTRLHVYIDMKNHYCFKLSYFKDFKYIDIIFHMYNNNISFHKSNVFLYISYILFK